MGCCIGCMDFGSLVILIFTLSPILKFQSISIFFLPVSSSWITHFIISGFDTVFIAALFSSHSIGSQLATIWLLGIVWSLPIIFILWPPVLLCIMPCICIPISIVSFRRLSAGLLNDDLNASISDCMSLFDRSTTNSLSNEVATFSLETVIVPSV